MRKGSKYAVPIAGLLAAMLVVILLNRFVFPERGPDNATRATPREASQESVVEALYYEPKASGVVECQLCFRRCTIAAGERGFCRTRENRDGVLYSLVYGQIGAFQVDPIEKEPMYHVTPGTQVYCIGTVGCNLRCLFCHNWHLSQSTLEERSATHRLPEEVVAEALSWGLPAISFTYNEPTVFYEYALDIAKEAKAAGLKVIVHTNGMMSPEPLRRLLEHVDAVTVDLKGYDAAYYEEVTQGKLDPVLQTLQIIREEGKWLEVVNLVVPTLNDDPETIRAMCRFIREKLGPHTPLHLNRFMPAYRLTSLAATPIGTLEDAYDIAKEEGLQFVMIGNVPGHEKNSTFCPECEKPIIERHHFSVYDMHIEDGDCGFCGHPIPGLW